MGEVFFIVQKWFYQPVWLWTYIFIRF